MEVVSQKILEFFWHSLNFLLFFRSFKLATAINHCNIITPFSLILFLYRNVLLRKQNNSDENFQLQKLIGFGTLKCIRINKH
jgi:hypothetical protein